MEQKRIEVIMATYNGALYIRGQVDTILAQTYQNWILTISDDGSTDGTDAIIDEYVRKHPDKIRRVFSGRKFGNAKEHFLWLIAQCDSDWIMTSDQDDVVQASKFEKMAALMALTESDVVTETPVLVFSDQTPTDAQLNPLYDSLMKMQKQYTDEINWRAIIFQNIVTGGACMFNSALAKLACQCKDESQVIMHDWWLAIVAARFGKIVYLNESTGFYRQHEGNSIGAKNVGSVEYLIKKLRHVDDLKQTFHTKKIQALQFRKTYEALLNQEDIVFLSGFGRNRSGIVFYLKYRFDIHGFFRWLGAVFLG